MNKYLKKKKCFSYEVHEKRFHSVVMEIIEFICIVILLFMGFFIYDTLMVKKSAKVDNYYKEYKPVIDKVTHKASLSELQELNPDVIAWITMDDTSIDYPILHNGANYSYINRNLKGESSLTGSLYTDVLSDRYFHDDYTVVYGHHMEGGMMLGSLEYYRKEDYLQEHLTGTLIAEDKVYDLTALALLQVDAYDKIYQRTTMSAFDTFKGDTTRYEVLSGTIEVDYDKLLILSTCYGGGMDRLILILRMEERK